MKKILNGKIVVGHSLQDDFLALKLNEEEYDCEIREISEFSQFKRPCYGYKTSSFTTTSKYFSDLDNDIVGYEKRKLKDLAREFLNA